MADIFKNITTQEWQDMEASEENPCVGTSKDADELIEQMSDEALLDQINAFDPYDVEFARRFRAQKARILADAEVIKAAEGLLVKRLKALQIYFDLSDEELESMTRDERADTIRQHKLITEALNAFNRAKQGWKGGE